MLKISLRTNNIPVVGNNQAKIDELTRMRQNLTRLQRFRYKHQKISNWRAEALDD